MPKPSPSPSCLAGIGAVGKLFDLNGVRPAAAVLFRLPHLSGNLRHDIVQETERRHVEELVGKLRPADYGLQHPPRHRNLRSD